MYLGGTMRRSRLCSPVFALLSAFLMFPPKLAGQTTSPTPPTSNPQAVALATQALVALTGNVQVSDVTLTGGTAARLPQS
jgi:hypothetical protein